LAGLTHHRHILEIEIESFRSKSGSATADKPMKEKQRT
jgi:hypothetical protein